MNAIAQAIGVKDVGDMPLEDKLSIALRHRRTLLLLDNFEQVLGAVPLVVELLASAPLLKVLITSRALLRVTGEHSFEVGSRHCAAPSSGAPSCWGRTRRRCCGPSGCSRAGSRSRRWSGCGRPSPHPPTC